MSCILNAHPPLNQMFLCLIYQLSKKQVYMHLSDFDKVLSLPRIEQESRIYHTQLTALCYLELSKKQVYMHLSYSTKCSGFNHIIFGHDLSMHTFSLHTISSNCCESHAYYMKIFTAFMETTKIHSYTT